MLKNGNHDLTGAIERFQTILACIRRIRRRLKAPIELQLYIPPNSKLDKQSQWLEVWRINHRARKSQR